MRKVEPKTADLAFSRREVLDVEIIGKSPKEWNLVFTAIDPVTEKEVTYGLLTRRGKLKSWADPRTLMNFLCERGIREGRFRLEEGFCSEKDDS